MFVPKNNNFFFIYFKNHIFFSSFDDVEKQERKKNTQHEPIEWICENLSYIKILAVIALMRFEFEINIYIKCWCLCSVHVSASVLEFQRFFQTLSKWHVQKKNIFFLTFSSSTLLSLFLPLSLCSLYLFL